MKMIRIENVSRRFGPVLALEDVSFLAGDGEAVGLLGPNGAGKTTLIRILTGLLRPTAGRVEIDGIPMEEDPISIKKRLGYLPENNPLYGDMRVAEYLGFAAEMKGLPRARIDEAVGKAVSDCGLAGWESRILGKLSKGYRQRVGLAAAIINDPALVVLDEPTSGLDPGQIVEFRALIRGLKGRRTILLSTHILADAGAVCDRVVVLRKGRIAAVDTVEALGRRLRPQAVWDLTVAGRLEVVEASFRSVSGILELSVIPAGREGEWRIKAVTEEERDPRQDFVRLVADGDLKLLSMRPALLTLEDIFMGLMTGDAE